MTAMTVSRPMRKHLVDWMPRGLVSPRLRVCAPGHDATAVQPSRCRPAVLDGLSACVHWLLWHPSRRPADSGDSSHVCVRRHAAGCLRARMCVDHADVSEGLDGWTDPASMRVCAVQHCWTAPGRLDGSSRGAGVKVQWSRVETEPLIVCTAAGNGSPPYLDAGGGGGKSLRPHAGNRTLPYFFARAGFQLFIFKARICSVLARRCRVLPGGGQPPGLVDRLQLEGRQSDPAGLLALGRCRPSSRIDRSTRRQTPLRGRLAGRWRRFSRSVAPLGASRAFSGSKSDFARDPMLAQASGLAIPFRGHCKRGADVCTAAGHQF
jgi:hypothetical protein